MICQLRGQLLETSLEKDSLRAVIEVGGVGYEVLMPKAVMGALPEGKTIILYVSESVTAYDGQTTLYGFPTKEQKEFFLRIKDNVGGMGPKKALECLDKISKSLPDFKRAIVEGDGRLLISVFGFSKKTAEKLIFSLKGKIETWTVSGKEKWSSISSSTPESDALSGLLNLGYREEDAREMVQRAQANLGKNADTEKLLKEALQLLGRRLTI